MDSFADDRLHCAARHERSAVKLEHGPRDLIRSYLGITTSQLRRREFLKEESDARQRLSALRRIRIVLMGQPQYSGAMKQRFPLKNVNTLGEFQPEPQRPAGPARVNFIWAIAHANDTRFASRARPTVRCPVRINQNHSLSGSLQLISGPRAEHSGADHRNVPGSIYL